MAQPSFSLIDVLDTVDDLKAIANATRIAILDQLRVPLALSEIRVPAHIAPGGTTPDAQGTEPRSISRQAVRGHLEKLMEAGFVRIVETSEGGPRYVADSSLVYALSERIRSIAGLRPETGSPSATLPAAAPRSERPAKDAVLVLVKGVDEGRLFPLGRMLRDDDAVATLGRDRGHDIILDFDPFVSADHGAFTRHGEAYRYRDRPGRTNPTMLNLRPVPDGTEVELHHGDLLGIGRSVLAFWTGNKRTD